MALTKEARPLPARPTFGIFPTLPYLPKEWMLDFKFMPIKLNKNSREEFILHMTVGGCCYGKFVTSLYHYNNYNSGKNDLFLKFAANNTRTVTKELSTLTVNKWMHIQISQELVPGKSIHLYKVEIDGEVVLSVENLQDSYFENVRVYAGTASNNDPAQSGYIKELVILEKPDKM